MCAPNPNIPSTSPRKPKTRTPHTTGVEPEVLLQRFFDATFPEKGGRGGRFYRVRLRFCLFSRDFVWLLVCMGPLGSVVILYDTRLPPLAHFPNAPTTPDNKQLYWWVLKAYGTSLKPVPLERLTEYYSQRMAYLGGGNQLAGQVRQ